jgi:hypothetical protein
MAAREGGDAEHPGDLQVLGLHEPIGCSGNLGQAYSANVSRLSGGAVKGGSSAPTAISS